MSALLEVKSLSKKFRALQALSDVSLHVDEGEILGVIGPNGAGKTTLFNLLSGVYQPNSGKIIFKGQEVQGEKPHKIARRGIGRTYQVCQPFKDLTVLDNVLMAYGINYYNSLKCFSKYNNRVNQENAMKYLVMVGLRDYGQVEAKNLSLVNQRRMEIARALALHPKIILMDESAAGLTHEESLDLIDLIFGLKTEGMSVILIEHNMHVAMKVSERIVVLNHGNLICQGSPETVQKDQQVIDAYLGNE